MYKNYLYWITLISVSNLFADLIVVISVPKGGNNLAGKVIQLLTGMRPITPQNCVFLPQSKANLSLLQLPEGTFPCTHLFCNDQNLAQLSDVKKIFIKRDPRDIILSYAHYVKDNKIVLGELNEILAKFINSIPTAILGWNKKVFNGAENLSTNMFMSYYKSWVNTPNTYVIKFENLISESKDVTNLQIQEILNLAKYLNINISKQKAIDVAKELNKKIESSTNWRQEYSDKNKQDFYNLNKELLINWKYE